MEIKDVKRKRLELEEAIFDLVRKFEEESESRVVFIHKNEENVFNARFPETVGITVSLEI